MRVERVKIKILPPAPTYIRGDLIVIGPREKQIKCCNDCTRSSKIQNDVHTTRPSAKDAFIATRKCKMYTLRPHADRNRNCLENAGPPIHLNERSMFRLWRCRPGGKNEIQM